MDVEHLKSKADNATYDIADAEARAAITELNSNLTDFKNQYLKNIGNSSDTELNKLTTPGIYFTWIMASSTCPAKGQWSIVIVASPGTNYCSQIVISAQTSLKIGCRYLNNGTWTSWFTS